MKISVQAREIPREQGIFNQTWEILKRHYNATTKSEWDALLKELRNTVNSAPEEVKPLAKGLCLAVADHIERKGHERQ